MQGVYKVDIRNAADKRLSERTQTADKGEAERAYRALLGRKDFDGLPLAARLISPLTGRAIYFSRFDKDYGYGRIRPDAPLDLDRLDDGTPEATAWQPPTNWDNDPRPFPEVLADWCTAMNGGVEYGSRPLGAQALRVSLATMEGWLKGRACPYEATLRLLMHLLYAAKFRL